MKFNHSRCGTKNVIETGKTKKGEGKVSKGVIRSKENKRKPGKGK